MSHSSGATTLSVNIETVNRRRPSGDIRSMATRARACTKSGSLLRYTASEVKVRSSNLSRIGRKGGSSKSLAGNAAPTHNFVSGGCSGFRRKSPVRTYETPATMCHASSIVKLSSLVATLDRTAPQRINPTHRPRKTTPRRVGFRCFETAAVWVAGEATSVNIISR